MGACLSNSNSRPGPILTSFQLTQISILFYCLPSLLLSSEMIISISDSNTIRLAVIPCYKCLLINASWKQGKIRQEFIKRPVFIARVRAAPLSLLKLKHRILRLLFVGSVQWLFKSREHVFLGFFITYACRQLVVPFQCLSGHLVDETFSVLSLLTPSKTLTHFLRLESHLRSS